MLKPAKPEMTSSTRWSLTRRTLACVSCGRTTRFHPVASSRARGSPPRRRAWRVVGAELGDPRRCRCSGRCASRSRCPAAGSQARPRGPSAPLATSRRVPRRRARQRAQHKRGEGQAHVGAQAARRHHQRDHLRAHVVDAACALAKMESRTVLRERRSTWWRVMPAPSAEVAARLASSSDVAALPPAWPTSSVNSSEATLRSSSWSEARMRSSSTPSPSSVPETRARRGRKTSCGLHTRGRWPRRVAAAGIVSETVQARRAPDWQFWKDKGLVRPRSPPARWR